MRNELSHVELVEKYLSGSMNAEEKFAFEARMHGDPALAKDVELQQMIINQIAFNAFKNDLTAFNPSLAKPWWKGRFFLFGLLGALLLATTFIFWISGKSNYDLQPNETGKHPDNGAFAVTEAQIPEADSRPQEELGERAATAYPSSWRQDRTIPDLSETEEASAEFNAHFVPGFRNVVMNSGQDFTFQMAVSKSTVHIPANSMRFKTGEDVTGDVVIRYREYRNSAEMAFSKIPMRYTENGTEYNFNSAGMFEIRAYQDGKELELKPEKPMTVDYNATEKLKNCYFWQLRDDKWRKLREIDFAAQDSAQIKQPGGAVDGANADPMNSEGKIPGVLVVNAESTMGNDVKNISIKRDMPGAFRFYRIQTQLTDSGHVANNYPDHASKLKISAKGFRTLTVTGVRVFRDTWTEMDVKLQPKRKGGIIGKIARTFTGARRDSLLKVKGSAEIRERVGFLVEPKKDSIAEQKAKAAMKNGNKLLASGIDAGHTYPNIVLGLNCPDFGVYNCDQIYQLSDRVNIKANFVDENGKKIGNGTVLSMIDLKFNGAFSNNPQSFACSVSGRTVLLLFTSNNKLYAIREEDFQAMKIDKSGTYTFKMKEMTKELKSTENLKQFLGLQ